MKTATITQDGMTATADNYGFIIRRDSDGRYFGEDGNWTNNTWDARNFTSGVKASDAMAQISITGSFVGSWTL